MSVIRRPGVLGQTTQRRLVGATSALSAAAIEALTVGTWFALVAVESRTIFTALAGLGVLLFGSLLRTGVLGSVTTDPYHRSQPMRFVAAIVLAASWLVWLLTAEWIGGLEGIAVAGAVLAVGLSIQFTLERRTYYRYRTDRLSQTVVSTIVPSVLVALGATVLLIATWLVDWSIVFALFPIGETTLTLEVGSIAAGFAGYGVFLFLAQQRRFHQLLTP
ncbi:hypothetical protein OB955_01930 [Halobacteria archaeon AArc-m2/3/4]|uniref:Uncharacterized protein n=1 Tax=Natronoglomus mannanivorans TaxID=2979990 RepID=A0AAP2YVR0_9EURY|nr:hypothetical protein [Halobacteria archaeon AArc-xg1-1]MCU4971501.1 hypothetical protein [Halobacteria archaeon AArc-m2/3/4]